MIIKQYFKDFIALFFPQTCVGCDAPLVRGEDLICTTCWYHMPYTHGHKDARNVSARQLWGRAQLEAVASYMYFLDASRVQQLLHQLKYRNRPEIGVLMGTKYGEILSATAPFNQIDIIVPIPLHPVKLRKRGYNQSVFFAQGLSSSMQRPVVAHCVARHRATESQTQKNRYERYENMLGTFMVSDPGIVTGKHILLADDVLTTGATIEACATVLLDAGAAKVSAVTIAKAV
ncbi:ComF family protein [Parapedobacter koreensis]|nr:ComF family protein [Parapedobacter koreensis]